MKITFTDATPDHAEGITKLRIATWNSTYRGIIPDSVLDAMDVEVETIKRRQWLEHPTPKTACIVALSEEQEVIGFTMFGSVRDLVADVDSEVYAIYILKEHQKLGIGRELLNRSFDRLRIFGFKKVVVWVLTENSSSAFYRQMGGVFVAKKNIEIGVLLEESGFVWDLTPRKDL